MKATMTIPSLQIHLLASPYFRSLSFLFHHSSNLTREAPYIYVTKSFVADLKHYGFTAYALPIISPFARPQIR